MSEESKRTETARRNDDHDLIENALKTPAQGGRSGGTLQRDIATRAEQKRLIDGVTGVTRVNKADEAD